MSEQHELEIDINEAGGYSSTGNGVKDRAQEAFESLGDMLSKAITPLREQFIDAAGAADEVEIKLDLGFKGEGKWVVMSMTGSATVSVKLVWKKK